MGLPARLADHIANLLPDGRLGDEIDVRIGIGFPTFALQNAARLTATGIVAGARNGIPEGNAFAVLAVFLERAMGEALLVAQLDPGEVEHTILHRGGNALSPAGLGALVDRGHNAERQMQPGAAVSDLSPGDQRQAITKARGRCRAAGALGDVLIDLAVFVRTRPETLDRGDDHFRIDALDLFPRKSHTVEHARTEIFNQHVALLDEFGENFLALWVFGVERDRALVVVEHGKIQAVDIRHVLQLPARDIANARAFNLDHVGAEPGQQLSAGRS